MTRQPLDDGVPGRSPDEALQHESRFGRCGRASGGLRLRWCRNRIRRLTFGAKEITIEDRNLAPMPVQLAITRADGLVQRVSVPVDVWLTGTRTHTVRVAARPAVVKVEIDPDGSFPDIDRANGVWRRM